MEEQTAVGVKTTVEVKRPPRYAVVLHNDDVTTMEFVVYLIMNVFFYDKGDAVKLMLTVHNEGAATVGVYEYDIALSKKKRADDLSAKEGFPLKITIEPKE